MKLHPTQPALALLCTAEHIFSTSPFLSEKTSQRNLPYPIRSQTPLLETGLCLPKMQPHRLGIVWYRVDMRDNSWSEIGSTAVVCQNKQLAERGISEESCQPRTLAISLQSFSVIHPDYQKLSLFVLNVCVQALGRWVQVAFSRRRTQ